MSSESKQKLVLVVDDDRSIIAFIRMVLSDDGFDCVGAMNGEEAMKKVAETNPSLILLDLSMPLMDGREFCEWLKSGNYSHIPVVIMTAGYDAERTRQEVGAQACLIKPFNLSDLENCVRKWATGSN